MYMCPETSCEPAWGCDVLWPPLVNTLTAPPSLLLSPRAWFNRSRKSVDAYLIYRQLEPWILLTNVNPQVIHGLQKPFQLPVREAHLVHRDGYRVRAGLANAPRHLGEVNRHVDESRDEEGDK